MSKSDFSFKRQLARNQAKYFKINMGGHNKTFINLVMCEIGNLAMVLINFHLVDKFLGGTFKSYGAELIRYLPSPGNHNPMCFAFPTVVIGKKITRY